MHRVRLGGGHAAFMEQAIKERMHADILVDEPLAKHWMQISGRPDLAPAQMAGLIEDNILQRTPDDQIAVHLEYKQGQLWINGIENEQWAALMVLLDMGTLEIDS